MHPEILRRMMMDQQSVLGFVTAQTTYIERGVIRILYPEIQYPQLIPIDTSAPEWTKSVTFFSIDRVGRAQWFNHMSTDMPLADIQRQKHEQAIEMAGIGYRYTVEEVGQAMMLNMPLQSERAEAARRASEEFIDDVALNGSTIRNWTGLINDPNVTVINAAATGTGGSAAWEDKTADQIITDVNDALTGVYTGSQTVELANTLLLPIAEHTRIATMPRATGSDMTVLAWIERYNVYTAQTGQSLMVRSVRGLENAAEGGDAGRMIAYRRDPAVVKLHIPMPHRFLPVWQTGPLTYDIPGILRIGGVEIRRPGAFRYVDGISNFAS